MFRILTLQNTGNGVHDYAPPEGMENHHFHAAEQAAEHIITNNYGPAIIVTREGELVTHV